MSNTFTYISISLNMYMYILAVVAGQNQAEIESATHRDMYTCANNQNEANTYESDLT